MHHALMIFMYDLLLYINDQALNIDLKNLTNWLNANKVSLNISKTELIVFKPKGNLLDFSMGQ